MFSNSLVYLAGNPFAGLLSLVAYLVIAFSLYKIADQKGAPNAWFAFVPILNLILLFQMAGVPALYLLLIIIPCVGWLIVWVYYMIAWTKIAEERGKPGFWGILAGLPILHIIIPPMIAFG